VSDVATSDIGPAPAPGRDSIVLETYRGERKIPVTLHYTAVRELRELAASQVAELSGALRGAWNGDDIVLEHVAAAASRDAVGIFRVQPGGWTALTSADREKLRGSGLERGMVLVLRTLAQRPWSATLFLVEPDSTEGDAPLAEFPWDEYVLRNGWLVDLAPPEPSQPLLDPTARPRRSRRRIAAGAAVLLIAIAAGMAAYRWLWGQPAREAPAVPPPDAAPPALALKVVRQAQDLDVSWDRGVAPVRRATAGTLTIRSGPATRVIEMRPDELREGHVVFRPLDGVDADVRLEVMEAAGTLAAESVRVLGFDTAPAVALPASAPATPPPAGAARRAARQPAAVPGSAAAAAGLRKPSPVEPSYPAGRSDAVPVRRATPELTSDVRNELRAARGKVTVSVEVSIDTAGKVDGAKVVSSSGEPSFSRSYIRLASLSAARQWRFRPATADGKAVPSQMTLQFTF
jgi:TonB family protein